METNAPKLRKIGFIITRHVNSEQTNQYWNTCIQCIRKFYPKEFFKIVVIDDNSQQHLVKAEYDYQNVEYIQSEFPGRGELLPYYYFFKHHFFERAVILHDSIFFQKKVNFNKIVAPVLPFWHFGRETKYENKGNSMKLAGVLKQSQKIIKQLNDNDNYTNLMSSHDWMGCFGVQCVIRHSFISHIQSKYNVFNLLQVVKNRSDRCCLERIMGVLFYQEFPGLANIHSLLGHIFSYTRFGYTFNEYCEDKKNNNIKLPLIKVWTGR